MYCFKLMYSLAFPPIQKYKLHSGKEAKSPTPITWYGGYSTHLLIDEEKLYSYGQWY